MHSPRFALFLFLSIFSGVLAEDFLCFPQLDEAQHFPKRLERDAAPDQQVRSPLPVPLSLPFFPILHSSLSHLVWANGMRCILNLPGPVGIGIIALSRVVLMPDEKITFLSQRESELHLFFKKFFPFFQD